MNNLEQIKERYLKEPLDKKIGHLASDLFRINTFLENDSNMSAVQDILEESKFFIEWLAPETPYNVQELLSEIQPKLALWHYHLVQKRRIEGELENLKALVKTWSENLLQISGLLVT